MAEAGGGRLLTDITPCRGTWPCLRVSENGSAVTGGTYYVAVVSGGSQIGNNCGRSLIDGFLVPALFILIPMCASTLVSKGGAVCGNSARTDLCGGWSAMVIPTAIPPRNSQPETHPDDERGRDRERSRLHRMDRFPHASENS